MRPGAFSLTFQKRREKSYCDAVRVMPFPSLTLYSSRISQLRVFSVKTKGLSDLVNVLNLERVFILILIYVLS